jgi:mRNA-degrading endonuclease RelE of RelBE toxin-antitoxin system
LFSSTFTDEALKSIKRLPKNVKNALRKELQKRVLVYPTECGEPLTNELAEFRSFHFGDYRMVYKVFAEERVVAVVGIGRKDKTHHTDLYRRLESLAKTGELAEAVLRTFKSLEP